MPQTQTAPSPGSVPVADPAPFPMIESPGPRCEVCGSPGQRTFEVVMDGGRHVFDSFECAIDLLAARCGHCGCRIIGHGVEAGGTTFCCEHCLRHGHRSLED